MTQRIAVVGAGIFGVSCAVTLANRGHRVTLYEAADEILCGASGINQYRLHRGYHYPRSVETATASRDSERSFRSVYGQAVVDNIEHYYGIAREGSLISGDAFVAFLRDLDLAHEIVSPAFLRAESFDVTVRVDESLFDPALLRSLAWERLRATPVDVQLGRRVAATALADFDTIVVAAYSEMNSVVGDRGTPVEYQFEVVEKPLVRPPVELAGRSVVVLDGPFLCLDPYGTSGLSVIGHVVHAIHHSNVGLTAVVPPEILPLLNRGVIGQPAVTNFPLFAEAAAQFMPAAARLEHVGSMFTIRTVLPGLDKTDARPTLVTRVDDRVISVFSGKIGTCVTAAEEVAALVGDQ
jgi:hypothetical protein